MTTMRRWAQLTGLAYLVLFVSGIVGFFLIRRQLYVPDDAMRTAANLVAHEGLARLGIAWTSSRCSLRLWRRSGSSSSSGAWTPSAQARSRRSGW